MAHLKPVPSCCPVIEPGADSPLGLYLIHTRSTLKLLVSLPSVGLKATGQLMTSPCLSSSNSHPSTLSSLPKTPSTTTFDRYYFMPQSIGFSPQLNRVPRSRRLLCCSWKSAVPGTTAPPWPGEWLCPLAVPLRAISWSWTMAMEGSTGSVPQNKYLVVRCGKILVLEWSDSNLIWNAVL